MMVIIGIYILLQGSIILINIHMIRYVVKRIFELIKGCNIKECIESCLREILIIIYGSLACMGLYSILNVILKTLDVLGLGGK